jgi:hypothetical protein
MCATTLEFARDRNHFVGNYLRGRDVIRLALKLPAHSQ